MTGPFPTRRVLLALVTALPLSAGAAAQEPSAPTAEEVEVCLARVRDYHGMPGPWAVVGYRIGARALKETGLERGSHDLEVVHRCPPMVQFTCMADGLHAATGASFGKRTLRLEDAPAEDLRTVVFDKAHGRRLIFTPKPELARAIRDLPFEKLADEGRRIATLPDSALFHLKIEPERP